MTKSKKTISPFGVVSAVSETVVVENGAEQVIKMDDFVAASTKAQSYIQNLIKHISREVNRNGPLQQPPLEPEGVRGHVSVS